MDDEGKAGEPLSNLFRYLRTKMILWVIAFIFPILLLLSVSLRWITNSYERQMNVNFSQSLVQYSADIDAALSAARRYIVSETVSLDFMETENKDDYARLQEIQAVGAELTENLVTLHQIDALFLYDGEKLIFLQNYNGSYKKNLAVSRKLEKELRLIQSGEKQMSTDYQLIETDTDCYLYFGNEIEGGMFGCWFSTDGLLDDLRSAGLEGAQMACFTDGENRILSVDHGIVDEDTLEEYSVTQRELAEAPFSLTVLWDKDTVYRTLHRIEGLTISATVLSVLLLAVYLVFLRKSLFVPLKQMVSDIDRLKTEEFQQLAVDPGMSVEFGCVYDALNAMTEEIKNLKISVYEKKIRQQKAQMELYQLQVRPHFFQNALLTIRSFSQEQEFEKVERMTNLLLRHCQYILYSNWFVLLDEELSYIQNYLQLQSIQHETKYQYAQSCPEELLDCEIPILIIQIFVENAVKYARKEREMVEIRVSVSSVKREGREYLTIEIQDTGVGLPGDIQEKLNRDESLHQSGDRHGIGIDNVRQRLRLIYGEQASLSFHSRQGEGTLVTLVFPVQHEEINGGEVTG